LSQPDNGRREAFGCGGHGASLAVMMAGDRAMVQIPGKSIT
jgi:hypothetical protein